MASITKFGFDTDFDIEPMPVEPPTVEPVPVEPAPVKLLTEQDLAAAREEGFAAGREAGLADATAAAQSQLAEAESALADQIGALGPGYQDTLAACRRDAIDIAKAIVRKTVAAGESDTAMAGIEQMIMRFLPGLLDEPRIVVRINDTLLDALQERVQSLAESCGFGGGIILLSEPGLALPDCRIEWADGGAEKDSGALWREIDAMIETSLAAAKGTGAEAEPPVAQDVQIDSNELKSEEKPDG